MTDTEARTLVNGSVERWVADQYLLGCPQAPVLNKSGWVLRSGRYTLT